MKERQIRRLPIVDREGRLCGLFTIGKVAKAEGREKAGDVLRSIVQPN
jgi:CBS domain-containing protein